MDLTVEDRLNIMELPARYADALDHLEPQDLPTVFTADAVWSVPDTGFKLDGLDEIMAFMGRPDVHPGAHLMTNIYIRGVEGTGDDRVVHLRSRGVYPVGPSDQKKPTGVFYGRYDDDVVPTADGWRIRHRRYRHGS